jgi:hypothetical protein
MAKFKCLLSGNVIEFTNQVDIDSMKGHEGYIRLDDEAPAKEVVKTSTKKTVKAAAQVEAE